MMEITLTSISEEKALTCEYQYEPVGLNHAMFKLIMLSVYSSTIYEPVFAYKVKKEAELQDSLFLTNKNKNTDINKIEKYLQKGKNNIEYNNVQDSISRKCYSEICLEYDNEFINYDNINDLSINIDQKLISEPKIKDINYNNNNFIINNNVKNIDSHLGITVSNVDTVKNISYKTVNSFAKVQDRKFCNVNNVTSLVRVPIRLMDKNKNYKFATSRLTFNAIKLNTKFLGKDKLTCNVHNDVNLSSDVKSVNMHEFKQLNIKAKNMNGDSSSHQLCKNKDYGNTNTDHGTRLSKRSIKDTLTDRGKHVGKRIYDMNINNFDTLKSKDKSMLMNNHFRGYKITRIADSTIEKSNLLTKRKIELKEYNSDKLLLNKPKAFNKDIAGITLNHNKNNMYINNETCRLSHGFKSVIEENKPNFTKTKGKFLKTLNSGLKITVRKKKLSKHDNKWICSHSKKLIRDENYKTLHKHNADVHTGDHVEIIKFNKDIAKSDHAINLKNVSKQVNYSKLRTLNKCNTNATNDNYVTSFYLYGKCVEKVGEQILFVKGEKQVNNIQQLDVVFGKYNNNASVSNALIEALKGEDDVTSTYLLCVSKKNNTLEINKNGVTLKKLNKSANISRNIITGEVYHSCNYDEYGDWCYKAGKKTNVFDEGIIFKNTSIKSKNKKKEKEINVYGDNYFVNKCNEVSMFIEYKWLSNGDQKVNLHDTVNISEVAKSSYIQHTHVGIGKQCTDTCMKESEILIECNKLTDVMQDNIKINKITNGYYDEVIAFNKRELLTRYPDYQNIFSSKELKDVICDKKEWVYNGTYDNDLDLTAGGIDELLLPQNDYDYEALIKKVLDDNYKPIKPIKIIDQRTFISKLPLNHPIPSCNIGTRYIDVDVQLLRHLLEVLYSLWKKYIFKFGAYTMTEAVEILLKDMVSYTKTRIPTQYQKQGERVIRLIRWYAENSIMKNSQYKVTVHYKDLDSELYNGVCKIPNVMSNLYVDNKKFMICSADTSKECELTFKILNTVDAKIKFKYYISNGTAKVFLNNKLVNESTNKQIEIDYLIPKSDNELNEFKIYYKPEKNGIINIGNILISNMVFDCVTTEFEPVLGSGNMIVDDIVKRLAVYADICDNNSDYIQDVIKGNLAVADLIKQLGTYFDIHHNKKSKGKRLVISKK